MYRYSEWLSTLLMIVAGLLGLLAGLALDRALFWTENSFLVLFSPVFGLLAVGVCHWVLRREHGHP